jgi:hypothetical protein
MGTRKSSRRVGRGIWLVAAVQRGSEWKPGVNSRASRDCLLLPVDPTAGRDLARLGVSPSGRTAEPRRRVLGRIAVAALAFASVFSVGTLRAAAALVRSCTTVTTQIVRNDGTFGVSVTEVCEWVWSDDVPGRGDGGDGGGSGLDPGRYLPDGTLRLIPIINSTAQTPCTLPDGSAGVVVVQAPVSGAAFETVCARPTDPAEPGVIRVPGISVQEALDATRFPNITAHFDPGPDAGLVGYRYRVWLSGAAQPRVAASVGGWTLNAEAEIVRYDVTTDTGGPPNDPDGYFPAVRGGSQRFPVGDLVWQTSGVKEVRIATTWRVRFFWTSVDVPGQEFANGEPVTATVEDITLRSMWGTVTRITRSE